MVKFSHMLTYKAGSNPVSAPHTRTHAAPRWSRSRTHSRSSSRSSSRTAGDCPEPAYLACAPWSGAAGRPRRTQPPPSPRLPSPLPPPPPLPSFRLSWGGCWLKGDPSHTLSTRGGVTGCGAGRRTAVRGTVFHGRAFGPAHQLSSAHGKPMARGR
jgi:hypothetical protein